MYGEFPSAEAAGWDKGLPFHRVIGITQARSRKESDALAGRPGDLANESIPAATIAR